MNDIVTPNFIIFNFSTEKVYKDFIFYICKCSYSSDGSEDACQLNVNGKNYEYLFWEGICNRKEDFEGGEVVGISKEKFVDELEELLGRLGLNEREINDFIVYWLTKLSNRKRHKVTICGEKYDNEIAPLQVDGFNQIHRVMLMFEEVDSIDGMKSVEDVVRRERPTGKYVIEWGAILA